jgi:hypothetical protein
VTEPLEGGVWKFRDHYDAIGAGEPKPVALDGQVTAEVLRRMASSKSIDLDLDALLRNCPLMRD